MLLGTLSNDDDDGSENVAKKLNLCSFKLTHVYLDPLNMSNAGDFSRSWILKILFKFKRGRKIRRGMSTSNIYIKRQIRRFHVVVVQWTSKKSHVLKSVMHLQSCCFAFAIVFWSCRRRRICLSSLLQQITAINVTSLVKPKLWASEMSIPLHIYISFKSMKVKIIRDDTRVRWPNNRPFYSCGLGALAFDRTWGWSWPCFDTNLIPFIMQILLKKY